MASVLELESVALCVMREERIVRRGFDVLLGVVFVAALAIVALNLFGAAAPNHVYTVAEVQAGLRRHPQAWAGRTVQMTGAVMMRIFE